MTTSLHHHVNDFDEISHNTAMTNDLLLLREPLLPESTSVSSNVDQELPPTLADVAATQQQQQQRQPRNLLFIFKLLYFLSGLSGAAWGRYGVIYYNSVKHLSDEQIGLLQGLSPLVSFVTQPIWGWLADWTQSRKSVFAVTQVGSTLALLALAVDPNNKIGYEGVLISVICMAIFGGGGGVMDAHVLDFLEETTGSVDAYGSIRMWAAVSWGLGCVGMGFITDRFGFEWNFGLFGGMMVATLLLFVWGLPARSKSEQARYNRRNRNCHHDNNDDTIEGHVGHVTEETSSQSSSDTPPALRWSILYKLLFQWQMAVWLCEVAFVGAGMSLVESFLFVFLQNDLGASTILCGYTVGVTVLFELPIFAYSRWLLQHVGHDGLFVAAMLAYVIRVWGYTFLTPDTVHWVLLLEILHGITFACMWVASVDFGARVAPDEWSTTVQSILSTFLSCVGGGIGPVVGGIIFERHGAIVMYRGAGGIVLAVMLLRILLWTAGYGHDDFVKQNQVSSAINDTTREGSPNHLDEEEPGEHECQSPLMTASAKTSKEEQ